MMGPKNEVPEKHECRHPSHMVTEETDENDVPYTQCQRCGKIFDDEQRRME